MSCLSQSSKKRRIREELKELQTQDQFILNRLDFEKHDDEAVGVDDKNNGGWYYIYVIYYNKI